MLSVLFFAGWDSGGHVLRTNAAARTISRTHPGFFMTSPKQNGSTVHPAAVSSVYRRRSRAKASTDPWNS